jgi:hypothetical protein
MRDRRGHSSDVTISELKVAQQMVCGSARLKHCADHVNSIVSAVQMQFVAILGSYVRREFRREQLPVAAVQGAGVCEHGTGSQIKTVHGHSSGRLQLAS